MESLINRLIRQLDTLIPFIALSYEDVFRLLNNERAVWFSNNQEALPRAYEVYRKQINHSALILGYSYFENFLNDLIYNVLKSRPSMLPKNKTVTYSDILKRNTIDEVIEAMINKELLELFYKSMSDIVIELRNKYNFTIKDDEKDLLCKGSLIRNCIIHNSSRADNKLANFEGYDAEQEFEISSSELHSFGIILRQIARRIYKEAEDKHLSRIEPSS